MKFIDQTEIHVTAGNGGDGMMSFRKARNKPKLGPDGGNGGNGGDVFLQADVRFNTLSNLRYRQVYRSESGGKGAINNKTGRCGPKKTIKVACGTLVKNRETGEIIGELIAPGDRLLVAKGGKRGYGNLNYTSATNRTPYMFTHGQKGENLSLALELKLLADIGLAGFPNAGKSTLLSSLSAARPKIADYPFTTLTPNLGVVDAGEHGEDAFVLADVPGLVEGASIGRGLGLEFLRHLERTKVIAYVIDCFDLLDECPVKRFKALRLELEKYGREMLEKPAVVVLNKLDLKDAMPGKNLSEIEGFFTNAGYECFWVSAVQGIGLPELKHHLASLVKKFQRVPEDEPELVQSMSGSALRD